MRTFFESLQKQLKLRFVATTPQERAEGLMNQPPLEPNEAALFVYETPAKGTFWNKNVTFPIDIGFFGADKKLIDIGHLEAQQEEQIGCKEEFAFALEVPVGFFTLRDVGKSLNEFINE